MTASMMIAMIATDTRRFVLLLFMLNIFPLNLPESQIPRGNKDPLAAAQPLS